MNDDYLFGYKMWQDMFLGSEKTVIFQDPYFDTRYLKYVIQQAALEGIFTDLSPIDIFGGYFDQCFNKFWDKDLYEGGDISISRKYFNMINGLSNPTENYISMYQGG